MIYLSNLGNVADDDQLIGYPEEVVQQPGYLYAENPSFTPLIISITRSELKNLNIFMTKCLCFNCKYF